MPTNVFARWCGVVLLFGVLVAEAAIDVYQFADETERTRFRQLTTELRCPKCQNQNIADSNAPIAQDLRAKIQLMLTEKKTDQEIVAYMIDRYGDFVLYQPRMDRKTYILWFGPVVLLLLGIVVVVWISRRNARNLQGETQRDPLVTAALDADQQKRIADLLKDTGNS